MSLWEIAIIAVGLSMDAFAVSITLGLAAGRGNGLPVNRALIPGLYFGLFQALMPFIGYFAGIRFAGRIQGFDHWAAFILLGFIGGKMVKDSFEKEKPGEEAGDKPKGNPFRFFTMLILALATSIDALAVGVTFAFFQINIFLAIAIIGLTTFVISFGGTLIGNAFGGGLKSRAEFLGGAVLVILGIKILVGHLFF